MKFCRLSAVGLVILTWGTSAVLAAQADKPASAEPSSVLDAATEVVTDAVAETVKAAAASVVQDKTLVLRISREFIRSRVPKVVDEKTPIDRCLLGARVTGEALTNGHPVVVEDGDPTHPTFTIEFTGTTTAQTRATQGPVRAYSSSESTFTVSRKIIFGADGFHAEKPTINCTYTSELTGVGVPPRLVGRVVKRIAMPQIEEKQPTANAIAKRNVEQEVLKTFTSKTDALVSDLNQRIPWEQVLGVVAPNGSERVRQLTMTPLYVEIRSTVVDGVVPDLPKESADLHAPIELWVLGQPGPVVSAELLALWGLSKIALPALQDAAEEVIEESTSDAIAASNTEDDTHGFEPQLLGDWWVLRLGADLMERFLRQANPASTEPVSPPPAAVN